MKNDWISYLKGTVRVSITGKGIERLMNQFIRNGISFRNVKKMDEQTIMAEIFVEDISAIRATMRKSGCKLFFHQKKGGPFLLKKMWRNSGFVLGLIAFLCIIMVLSNMVWKIDVKGATPYMSHRIMKELDAMGVQKGKLKFVLDDPDTIQRKLTEKIQDLTWVGVEVKGTAYHFQVVEKNIPKVVEQTSPGNIIAKKKAVVTYMFVEKGQPLVKVHDFVQRGQLLVSGVIGKNETQKVVASKGAVYGEVWYKAEVSIPLDTSFQVLTGKSYNKHYLQIFGWKMPVWAFNKETYASQKVDDVVQPVYFFKWKMPLSYEKISTHQSEHTVRHYSRTEAVKKGIETGRKELESKIDKDAKIKGEKVLHQSIENGKVKLVIHYQVIENIAMTQPIIQGD